MSSRYEDEFEDAGHRRHHHHRSSRPHSSRHSREDPEERGRSGSPPRYRRHCSSSSLRRGEEATGMRERSRDYGGERAYGRPDEVNEFQPRSQQSGYYESRSRGEPREYSGRGWTSPRRSTVATVVLRCRRRATDRVGARATTAAGTNLYVKEVWSWPSMTCVCLA